MNLPNKLSIIRVALIPVIVILLYQPSDACRIIAGALFIIASLTDFLDGYIARKYNLVTNFGKFIDPVADKLLVLSTFVLLLSRELIPAWMVILILARELSVDGLRLIAISNGKVIAAGPLGKIKTASQMIFLLLILLLRQPAFSFPIGILLAVWICVITLWSGIDYFVRNRSLLR